MPRLPKNEIFHARKSETKQYRMCGTNKVRLVQMKMHNEKSKNNLECEITRLDSNKIVQFPGVPPTLAV